MTPWLPIRGFEGLYEISRDGRVRGLDRTLSDGRKWRGGPCSLKRSKSGHLSVRLCVGGKHHWKWVHRLVLEAFGEECPPGMECAHNNGVADDNRFENLRWDTRKGNQADKVLHGTSLAGERNNRARLSSADIREIRAMSRRGHLGTDIAARFGVTPANISSILTGSTWRHVT